MLLLPSSCCARSHVKQQQSKAAVAQAARHPLRWLWPATHLSHHHRLQLSIHTHKRRSHCPQASRQQLAHSLAPAQACKGGGVQAECSKVACSNTALCITPDSLAAVHETRFTVFTVFQPSACRQLACHMRFEDITHPLSTDLYTISTSGNSSRSPNWRTALAAAFRRSCTR